MGDYQNLPQPDDVNSCNPSGMTPEEERATREVNNSQSMARKDGPIQSDPVGNAIVSAPAGLAAGLAAGGSLAVDGAIALADLNHSAYEEYEQNNEARAKAAEDGAGGAGGGGGGESAAPEQEGGVCE